MRARYSENNIEPTGRRLRNLAKHVDSDLPQKVKELIAKAKCMHALV